jgi:hypothetical protein
VRVRAFVGVCEGGWVCVFGWVCGVSVVVCV